MGSSFCKDSKTICSGFLKLIVGGALCTHRRHSQNPFTYTLLGDGDSSYRRRKVASRTHPIPDLVEIPRQVGLKLLDRLLIHTGRSAIGFHRLLGFEHHPLIVFKSGKWQQFDAGEGGAHYDCRVFSGIALILRSLFKGEFDRRTVTPVRGRNEISELLSSRQEHI